MSSGGRTFGGMGGGPPSWICDVTSGRHLRFVVTSLPVAILDLWSHDFRSRDFRSRDYLSRDFRTGNHVIHKWKGHETWKSLGYRSFPACPATIWIQPLGGRCPATTWTQSLGGLLIWISVLPPHELNHWKNTVLPPHELNRWEDFWHELLSCHHSDSTGGRTLDLPPKELNPWEVHLSTTRAVMSSNHSSLAIHWECL